MRRARRIVEFHKQVMAISSFKPDNRIGKCTCLSTVASACSLAQKESSHGDVNPLHNQEGQLKELLDRLDQHADFDALTRAIVACGNMNALLEGKRVHAHIVMRGLGQDLFLGNYLVHMYLKCGSAADAWQLFSQLQDRDVITWTRLIAAYAQNGHFKGSFQIFQKMQMEGVPPDRITFITLANMCAKRGALEEGRMIHGYVAEKGLESDVVVGNALVDLYGKCKSLEDAHRAFDNIGNPDVISWNTLIAAHGVHSTYEETLYMFQQMQLDGVKPDKFTLVTILNVCSRPATVANVKQIHDRIIESGLSSDTVVCNALVNMYGKAGHLGAARGVFEGIYQKDLISWNAIISACTQVGRNLEALRFYRRMQLEAVLPNDITFLIVMDACTSPTELTEAKFIHANIVESGHESSVSVANAVITMYGRCGSLDNGRSTFDRMPDRDVISWNSLIAAYAQNGYSEYALELYHWMQLEGVLPTNITHVTVLNACTQPILELGKLIHANVVEAGYEFDDITASALVDMYGKCGSLQEAQRIFTRHPRKNVILWTAMMAGYAEAGNFKDALQLFKQMELDGVRPNKITFVTVVNACASIPSLVDGKLISAQLAESGYGLDSAVKNALLNLHAKCGSLEDVHNIFKEIQHWDVVACTVMVSAYSQCELWREALGFYHRTLLEGTRPNTNTFVAVLTACSCLAASAGGKQIHACIVEGGFASSPVIQSALVNFYGKCGSLEVARRIFEGMEHKGMVVPWTAIIAGYAQHGHINEAQKLFHRMQQEGTKPDNVTFVSILSVCSHAGLVEDACHYLVSMTRDLGIPATIEHYGCMVDLLGRSGWLKEAAALIERMTVRPDAVMWMSLLGASSIHGDLKLAKHAAEQVLELDPQNAPAYVQLSNIYAAIGNWAEVEKLKKLMMERGVEEDPKSMMTSKSPTTDSRLQ